MHIDQYLNRIEFKGDISPSLSVLNQLQELHLLAIPFENLDIHHGRKIKLDLDLIYDKIIHQRRGGFCYELNGLFYWLLNSIGYQVKMISGRVNDQKGGFGPEFDHLALVVHIDARDYLVDVGCGEFAFHPIRLALGHTQIDERGLFTINEYDDDYWSVSKTLLGKKEIEYLFSLQARSFEDFAGMCHYHQTNSKSHFLKQAFITRPTNTGRISLHEDKLKIRNGEHKSETAIDTTEEFNTLLKDHFYISI